MTTKKVIKKVIYRTKQVLEFIIEVSIAVPESFMGEDVVYKGCKSIFSMSKKYTESTISKNISELKRYGYIKKGENNSIVLTNKTKLKYIEKFAKKTKKDHKLRFISYDIPEPLRRKRDQFRSSIRKMEFVKIQKSLWVTDRDVTELLEMVIKGLGIEDYVIYIVSDKTNVDKMIETFLSPKDDAKRLKKGKKSVFGDEYLDFSEFRKKIRW